MPTLIEANLPTSWHDLQSAACRVLQECGFDAAIDKTIETVRGPADVDIFAQDKTVPTPSVLLVECKLWKRRVSRGVVHAFRTIVTDSGANYGLIVSSKGFQPGAYRAAGHSNVVLVDWVAFQELFCERWYQVFFVPAMRNELDPLVEYTEPINSRVFRAAGRLSQAGQDEFRRLRLRHQQLGVGLLPMWFPFPGVDHPVMPHLPLRDVFQSVAALDLPASLLDATALRPLLQAIALESRRALSEFDSLFGGRV